MSNNFVVEGPEDFSQKIEFDKFMDEITTKEEYKRSGKPSDGVGEYAKRRIERNFESPSNRTRWRR